MRKLFEIWKKHALWAVFCICIFGIGAVNIPVLYQAAKNGYTEGVMNTSTVEESYDNGFWKRLSFVDMQGLQARILGQKINNGVIKGTDGKLNLMDNLEYKFDSDTEKKKSDKAIEILRYAQENGAEVLYVQRPWATGNVPYGYEFELDRQYDFWCDRMVEAGFPVLDLREVMGEELEFYVTDHHWTVRSSFYANKEITGELNKLYDLKLDEKGKYTDIDNYISTVYEEAFLGSEGIRTGKYFVGKDDFETLIPGFETNFSYEQYNEHQKIWEASGNFEEVYINKDLLENMEYYNKYNIYTYNGYIENRIINHYADNNQKAMLIADSFARPMVTYMSANFRETRYLDPQEGRYTGSYVEYIEEYKPDVVIMMFPGDGEFKEI